MKKPYKTDSTILGLPVVISEVWPPAKVECLDSSSPFNLPGGLEIQCSKATFDEMVADPAKKAIVADTIRRIQIALRRKRRVSNRACQLYVNSFSRKQHNSHKKIADVAQSLFAPQRG